MMKCIEISSLFSLSRSSGICSGLFSLYYNSIDSNQSYFPQSGEFCVAKSPTDSNWYRSRIIRLVGTDLFSSPFNVGLFFFLGNEKAQLIFIDSGQLGEINVNFILPLNRQFSDRPAQALACTLAQVYILFRSFLFEI